MKNLWNEYDPDVLASAVDYFASFLEEPNKEVVKKWVEKNVPANEMFLEDMEDGDFIDNEELGDPFPEFYEAFAPRSERWDEFCQIYEEIFGVWLQEWENFDHSILKEVIELFQLFVKVPDEEINEWVYDNINPSYELQCAEDYESQIDIIYSMMGEDPFLDFYEAFAPDTSQWARCCGLLIDLGAGEIEEICSDDEE